MPLRFEPPVLGLMKPATTPFDFEEEDEEPPGENLILVRRRSCYQTYPLGEEHSQPWVHHRGEEPRLQRP